jgi:hypothetical protein
VQLFWKNLLTPELGCLPASGNEHELQFGGLGPTTAAPASWAKMMQVERSVKSTPRRHLLRADHPYVPGQVGPDRVGDVRQRGADASARLQGVGAGRGDAEPMRDYRRSVG